MCALQKLECLHFFSSKKLISINNTNLTKFRRGKTFCGLGEPSYAQLRNTVYLYEDTVPYSFKSKA
jgi:hypothetical protein